jgi:hypothetical protein
LRDDVHALKHPNDARLKLRRKSLFKRGLGAMIIDRVRATQLPINIRIWSSLPRQLFPPRLQICSAA